MVKESHPLTGNKKWVFNQPEVGFRAHYVAVDKVSGAKELLTMESGSTCREGVIYNIRATFRTRLTNYTAVAEEATRWGTSKTAWIPTRDCDLIDPAGKREPATLKIHWYPSYRVGWEDFPIEKFLRVCDTVIGPVAVLLGPWRPKGNWWRTDPKKALRGGPEGHVHWNGTDSWFLAHPATAAIATGLYRQCFHLCGAGVADRIIDSLSEEEISEVMSTNSQKLALLLIKKTRDWIEVPVGMNGARCHYPFPLGFWRRLVRLQRAIRSCGYEGAMGQSFHEGWATSGGIEFRGVYGFWGDDGELTANHHHLMKAGAPRRQVRGKIASNGS